MVARGRRWMAVVVFSALAVILILYRNILEQLPWSSGNVRRYHRLRDTHLLFQLDNDREETADRIGKSNDSDQPFNQVVVDERIPRKKAAHFNESFQKRDVIKKRPVHEKPVELSCVNVTELLERNELKNETVKDKFKRTVPVMLMNEADVVSDVAARWWNSLQPFKPDKSFSQVMKELFQILPKGDPFHHFPGRCRRCAVVGGAGNLIGSNYGSLIDSKEVVIRMNKAPIQGFEKDVGSKTTHHIVYPESSWPYQGSSLGGKLVLLPFKLLDIEWLISIFTTHNISR
jgi:hypothetical protein